jgi:biopolymer transport protein ExbB
MTMKSFSRLGQVMAVSVSLMPLMAVSAFAQEPAGSSAADQFTFMEAMKQGGPVAWGTLAIMVIMSIVSWYLIVTKFIDQKKIMDQSKELDAKFWQSKSLAEGASKLAKDSAFRQIVDDGLRAAQHHEGRLTDKIDQHEWITMSLQRSVGSINGHLQGGLAFLATVGSTAPFVGLFGTVVGIYRALIKIAIAGQASIDKVAGPVGEALIMTAIGLAVAVPAVCGYNWLLRRNKAVMDKLNTFANDVHAFLMSGTRIERPQPAPMPAAAPAPAAKK